MLGRHCHAGVLRVRRQARRAHLDPARVHLHGHQVRHRHERVLRGRRYLGTCCVTSDSWHVTFNTFYVASDAGNATSDTGICGDSVDIYSKDDDSVGNMAAVLAASAGAGFIGSPRILRTARTRKGGADIRPHVAAIHGGEAEAPGLTINMVSRGCSGV